MKHLEVRIKYVYPRSFRLHFHDQELKDNAIIHYLNYISLC